MIQLQSDCLVFRMSTGELIPFSAESITMELLGESASVLDPLLVKNAAQAVSFYFKSELEKASVSIEEFSIALTQVLRGFGLDVVADTDIAEARKPKHADLRLLACETALQGFELFFFQRLREEMSGQFKESPKVVEFRGLRECVKHLVGAQRWCKRCRLMRTQIICYMRTCLAYEGRRDCALVVK